EAVWEAVFVPLWSLATSGSAPRRSRSELTQRLEESWRTVLRGHPRSERDELSALAAEAVATYQASRAQLRHELVCGYGALLETGESLGDALHAVESRAASLKEQLIDEVWAAVDPAMAAKLIAYAET